MTVHEDADNPYVDDRVTSLDRPAPYVLYLGRSIATAEALRPLLETTFFAGSGHNGNAGDEQAAQPHGAQGNDALPTNTPRPAGAWLEVVTNQKLALRHIVAQPPSLVLVETSSRRDSRLRFCQALRLRLPTVAIMAVSGARSQAYDFAFEAQLHTPVEPSQALAALCSVRAHAPQGILRRGAIALDVAARRVITPKGMREMTPKQCALLELLMRNPGVVRRAEIMLAIWETSYLEDTRTLDVHIHWLREMIEPEPAYPIYLLTQRGIGYRFTVPDEAP